MSGVSNLVGNIKNRVSRKTGFQMRVCAVEQISKHFIRFCFSAPDNTFSRANESGYLKLHFTDVTGRTCLRSYTIREVDLTRNTIIVDFVNHGDGGPASAWAGRAKVGDTITAGGPGPSKLVNPESDWFLLAGDMSALPAIAANIKNLPADAKGYALIEVADLSDVQVLHQPLEFEVDWLINDDPSASKQRMLNRIKEKPWLSGSPYVWVAGEFDTARALRQYFRDVKGVTTNRYISSYWKMGETDEGNKKAKQQDGGF